MEKKVISVGQEATEKFLRGVKVIDELVGGTIGPFGRNRIIYRKYASPLVTNDGVTIARHTYLDDEIEDLAAQTLVEIAMKTNDVAGDGTTSAVVEAATLITSSIERIKQSGAAKDFGGGGLSAMQLAREIRAEMPKALALLETQKRDLTDKDLDSVIATSLENLEYGKKLGELLREVGQNGYVSVEDNWATKYGIDTEITKGMRFLGTYATPYLATSSDQKDAVWENTLVLVTNQYVESIRLLAELLKEMKTAGKTRLVIIGGFSEGAAAFSRETVRAISASMQEAAKGTEIVQVLAIKAPTLTSAELEDVAVFCNAKFIDKNLGMELSDVRLVHLGSANKVVADQDEVNIIEGAGDPTQRIQVLKEQIDREKDAMFEEKTKRRIASLAAGVGIIRVGAATEQERTYLKHKLEDAVNAAKAAMEEGVVDGGGLALKKVAEEFGKEHILYAALMAPYNRIRDNAGFDLEIGPEVLDAYKVVRVGFENACSAATALITCDGGISVRRQTLFDMWEKKMVSRDDEDDFRDGSNQDRGRRSRNLD